MYTHLQMHSKVNFSMKSAPYEINLGKSSVRSMYVFFLANVYVKSSVGK